MDISYSTAIAVNSITITVGLAIWHSFFFITSLFSEDPYEFEPLLSTHFNFCLAIIASVTVGAFFQENVKNEQRLPDQEPVKTSKSVITCAVFAVLAFFLHQGLANFATLIFPTNAAFYILAAAFLPGIIFYLTACCFIVGFIIPRAVKLIHTSVFGNVVGVGAVFLFCLCYIPFSIYNKTLAKWCKLPKIVKSFEDYNLQDYASVGSCFALTSFVLGSLMYPVVMQYLEKQQVERSWQIILIVVKMINLVTATLGFHQSFNTMIVTVALLTDLKLPEYHFNFMASLSMIYAFQFVSAMAQALIGYFFPTLPECFIKTQDDACKVQTMIKDFEKINQAPALQKVFKAMIFGYNYNGLGDSVYSIMLGYLAKKTGMSIASMLVVSVFKEVFLLPSTTLATASAFTVNMEPSVIYKILVFSLLAVLLFNQGASVIIMGRKMKTCVDDCSIVVPPPVTHFKICKTLMCIFNLTLILCLLATKMWFSDTIFLWKYMAILATFANAVITGLFFCELVVRKN
jgi:hypothetical protein